MRIIIADDHPLFRKLIRQALERYPGFEIVAEAADGQEVLRLLDLVSTDVLLMDIEMPGLTGIEVIRALKERNKDVPVLLISSYLDPYLVEEVLLLGASGYLVKDDAIYELPEAVTSVFHKRGAEAYLSRTVQSGLNSPQIF